MSAQEETTSSNCKVRGSLLFKIVSYEAACRYEQIHNSILLCITKNKNKNPSISPSTKKFKNDVDSENNRTTNNNLTPYNNYILYKTDIENKKEFCVQINKRAEEKLGSGKVDVFEDEERQKNNVEGRIVNEVYF